MKDISVDRWGPFALITGASSGIGKAFAELLAERGFHLVLVARRGALLMDIQSDLQSRFDVKIVTIVQDLTEADAAETIFKRIQDKGIEIGLLINNAGYGSYGHFETLDFHSELAMIDLACRAMMGLAYWFIPAMKKRGRGGIVFISSIVSQIPTPYMATYSAGKSFEFSLSNALYGELRPYGIDVLAVLPGTTATDFFDVARMTREMSFPKATPGHVARTALHALGRKPYVVDGWANKSLVFLSRFIPIRWLAGIARFVLRPKK